ncbi:MAG: hypothetical protein AAF092_05075 [Pseudomonadota bacterium]
MITVDEDGRVTANTTPEEAAQLGYSAGAIAAAEQAEMARTARIAIRQQIAATAGDTKSLLGTTSDAAALALLELAKLSKALSTANSLAEVRAAAQPLADLTAPLLARVESGVTKLPHLAKGADVAIAEMEARATAVTEALSGDL